MDFFELILNRESVRSYDPHRPVESDKIQKILKAGHLAPSAANRQPWRFYLVSTPEYLDKVRDCYHKSWFKKAPHLLLVTGKKDLAWTRSSDGFNSLEMDIAIAMDHMILQAESLGVSTCWIVAFDTEKLHQLDIVEEGEVVYAITPLGYPEKDFKKHGNKVRKSFNEVVKFL
jgi:nitroreductase